MDKKELFLSVFRKAEKKYGGSAYRLAADGWEEDWQTLIATIMSAQSRDETTIPIAERLFIRYDTIEKLAHARYDEVIKILKSMNYNKTKAKNIISSAKILVSKYSGHVPDTIEELIMLPGVGRKTANLVLSEIHSRDTICVDTHVHRLSNVLSLVKTRTPHQTEIELQKIAPRKYWSRINRIFVLWGKEVRGRDKEKILRKL
ncbi:MAG: endonuclease III [Nanoarchaeota archaeon]